MKNVKKQILVILLLTQATIFDARSQSATDNLKEGFSSIIKKTEEKATVKYNTVKKYLKEKVSDADAGKIFNDIMANNGISDEEDAIDKKNNDLPKENVPKKKKVAKKQKTEKEDKIDLDQIRFEKKNKAYELSYPKNDSPSTIDLAYRMMINRKNATINDIDENVIIVSHAKESGEEDCTWKLKKIGNGLWKFKITKAEDISVMEKYLKAKVISKIVEESFVTTQNSNK